MAPNANADIATVEELSTIKITTVEKERKPKKVEKDALPHQDHGYAWVVVFAMFLYNVTSSGTYKAFGVIYVGLIDLFGAGELQTSLVTVAFSASSCVGSMFTGWLADRFPHRNIVVAGAVIAAVGFVISSFATNIYLVIFGYGILAGFASACFDSPLMCAMAQYWNKRKSLANGIGYSGTSLGTLILPLIYTLLIEEYTVRGTLLLAGGLWLQIAIGGMLLRPAPKYKSRREIKEPPEQNPNETVLSVKELTAKNEDVHNYLSDMIPEDKNDNYKNLQHNDGQSVGNINKAFIIDETFKVPLPDEKHSKLTHSEKISQISPVVAKKESQENTMRRKRTLSTSNEQGYKAIITNLAFVRLLLMTGLSAFAVYPLLFLLPSLALEWGANDVTASLTITVSGAVELFSRLSLGYCIDRFHLNKVRLWSAANLLMGLIGIAVAHSNQVLAVLFLGGLLGMCGTILTPLLVPIMSECIPAPLLGRATGLVLFMFGVGPAAGYAVVGQMSQSTGSYVDSAILLSFAFLFVSVIGFTDVIGSIIKKTITRFRTNPKDNPKTGNICDDEGSCSIDEEEPEYNIQTVINQDFISTWL